MDSEDTGNLVPRWWFGGLSAAISCIPTHPLDVFKIQFQVSNVSTVQAFHKITKDRGLLGVYRGLSAQLLRQLTYSTTRFAIYEKLKTRHKEAGKNLGFYQLVWMAMVSGATGGLCGNPADMINVRMLNDYALPPEMRRNYRHVFHAISVIVKDEGVRGLFKASGFTAARTGFNTAAIFCSYDTFKAYLLRHEFQDNPKTHIFSSFIASTIATFSTQPVDVVKTRIQTSPNPVFSSICKAIWMEHGLFGFWRGLSPSFVRIIPHCTIMYLIFEYLRINFGYHINVKDKL